MDIDDKLVQLAQEQGHAHLGKTSCYSRIVQMFAPMFALYKLYSPLEVEQSYWDALSSFMSGILGTFLLFFFENI